MTISSFTGPYRFLSNFYPCEVTLDGVVYPTTEHAFQAAKTLDKTQREKIRKALTPGQAKRLGQKVYLRSDWEHIKFKVMEELLRQKFTLSEFKIALLETGSVELIEENHWRDRVWGVYQGQGKNHLGKLLMKIRKELS